MFYEIYQLAEDLYQVHSSDPTFKAMEGSVLVIMTYLVYSHNFKTSELEYGLLSMISSGRDAAHFDSSGRFVYSFNKGDKYGKSA